MAHTYGALHKPTMSPLAVSCSTGPAGAVLFSGSVIRWRGFSPAFSYYGAEFLGLVSDNEIVSKSGRIVELATKSGVFAV